MSRSIANIPELIENECGQLHGGPMGDYFNTNTGRLFDELVLTSDRMRFTATDVVAVRMLSVELHPEGVKTLLLNRHFAADCSDLLHEIPCDVPLAHAEASLIDGDGPAQQLWNLLKREVHGVHTGGTVLFKLLAAKRPLLLPIWDSRVARAVDLTDGQWWEPMRLMLSDPLNRERLELATADAPSHVGLLRRIDVALWRYGSTLSPTADEATRLT
jgi:hypothetical protein